jgi:hypothetical protein
MCVIVIPVAVATAAATFTQIHTELRMKVPGSGHCGGNPSIV